MPRIVYTMVPSDKLVYVYECVRKCIICIQNYAFTSIYIIYVHIFIVYMYNVCIGTYMIYIWERTRVESTSTYLQGCS